MNEQFLKIKKLLDTKLSVVYKRLSIGPILIDGKYFTQVDCDRYDLQYSMLYSPQNINFAIAKFTMLLAQYMASELRNKE